MNATTSRAWAIGRSAIVAVLLIGAWAAMPLFFPGHTAPEPMLRFLGMLTGLVVVVQANAVPKALGPLAAMRCNPTTEQALRRFAGWALLLGGLGYAVALLFAPLAYANLLSGALMGLAVLLVVARYGYAMAGRARAGATHRFAIPAVRPGSRWPAASATDAPRPRPGPAARPRRPCPAPRTRLPPAAAQRRRPAWCRAGSPRAGIRG